MAEDRPATVQEIITGLAKQQGVSPALALAVAQKESNQQLDAPIGSSGEKGIFQLMPDTAKALGVDAADPLQNITGGIKYLAQLRDRFGGDVSKVLQGYNGGPEHVDAGTVSPQAQAYAAEVLGNLSKTIREKQTTTAPPPGAPVEAPPKTRAEFMARKAKELDVEQYTIPLSDVAAGIAKKTVERISEAGAALRKRFPSLDVGPSVSVPTERTTTGENIGAGLEQVAEFAVPGALGKVAGLTGKAALALEGAGTYGVAKSQDSSTPTAAATALLSMVPGFAALREPQKWYASAEATMTRILESAAKAKNETQVKQAAAKVLPLAMDQSLLRLTKGAWAKAVDEGRQVVGKAVNYTLGTNVGDEPLPISYVIGNLEKLKQKAIAMVPGGATKLAQVRAGLASGLPPKAVTIEPAMVKIIDQMQAKLTDAAGPTGTIQARELVKFRRNWDRFVYKSKPFLDPTARTEFKKEAFLAGADSIRHVIATEPAVSLLDQVDKSFSMHNQLYSLIGDVAFKDPSLPIAFGWKKVIAKKLLQAAVASPSWRLASVKTKLAIADAVTSGSIDTLRRLTTPLIASAISGGDEETTAEPASASR